MAVAVSVRFAKDEPEKAGGALRAKCGEAWPASSEAAGRPRERAAERANTILNTRPRDEDSEDEDSAGDF